MRGITTWAPIGSIVSSVVRYMLQAYLQAVSEIELLTPEAEQALWQAYAAGDGAARQELIEHYQPLVVKEVVRFRGQEALLLDLVQEGAVGLMEAVERYNRERGVAFSLFAKHRIRGRMLDYLYKNGHDIPVSEESWAAGRERFDGLLAAAEDAFEITDRKLLWEQVRKAVLRLPEKERLVVAGIYLGEREPKEVAAEMSCSKAYVYKLQKTGIRRLRGMLSRVMQERKE